MMAKYDVYGIGNALVDMEYEVELADLTALGLDKGVMTLVDDEHLKADRVNFKTPHGQD